MKLFGKIVRINILGLNTVRKQITTMASNRILICALLRSIDGQLALFLSREGACMSVASRTL